MSTENFKKNIRDWVMLDNKYKELNESLKTIREEKKQVLDKINVHINNNNLNDAVVKISDGKIKFSIMKNTKPLTLQYIKECLTNTIRDANEVEKLMEYIKNNRECSYTDDIKRYYNNK